MARNANLRSAKWLREFEKHLITLAPHLAGRVDWDTAIFLMSTGKSPREAAEQAAGNMRPRTPWGSL